LKSTRILLLWSPELYVHLSVLKLWIYRSPLYTWIFLVPSSNLVIDRDVSKTILPSPKEVRGSAWLGGDSEDPPARILISQHYSFCWGEITLLFPIDKSLVGGFVSLDSRSSSISASLWDDTLASGRSPGVITIVWWFRAYFFQALLKSRTSAIHIIEWYSVVHTIYRDQRFEQSPCVLGVFILIQILSQALFIFFFISLEFIRGFYWLGPRVNLPVLQLVWYATLLVIMTDNCLSLASSEI